MNYLVVTFARDDNLLELQNLKDFRGINIKDRNGLTALHHACKNNNLEMVEFLLEKGANVHAINRASQTPLYEAITNKNIEIIKLLLEYGSDINHKDEECGQTPLLHAYLQHRDDLNSLDENTMRLIGFLLDNGADSTIEDAYGCDVLWYAKCSSQLATKNYIIIKMIENREKSREENAEKENVCYL